MQTNQSAPADSQTDVQAIRDLVKKWLTASEESDLATMLNLLADDVVFMVPNQEPFGKDLFASNFQQMKGIKLKAESNILEIKVMSDWAWMRSFLSVTFTDPKGESATHAGYILTVLRKDANNRWVIARDANLLMPKRA